MARQLLRNNRQDISQTRQHGQFCIMKHFSRITLTTAVLLMAWGAAAAPNEDKIRNIIPEIQSTILQQDIIDALRSYNERHEGISQADIDRMEADWQSELSSPMRPLISSVIGNPVAERMRDVVEKIGAEDIVVIDSNGLSVAHSTMGTEFWLGQEEAFTETVRSGPDAIFIDDIEFNEPTQSFQSRVSFTVADPDTGKPIGAVTIGFNADAL